MKNERITRRAMCAAGILSAGCKVAEGSYFGRNDPPSEQRLIYILNGEPATFDPGKTTGGWEAWIIPAMFEGLTNYHPRTAQPMAGLATHYEVNGSRTQFTFSLRGHPSPRGARLPNTETLRMEYDAGLLREDLSRGLWAPPDRIPARWSDGTTITAHDFVYSWRRVVDPATATSQLGYYLYYIKNAQDISAGKLDPQSLGIRSLDNFTLQVDLRAPTAFFLELTTHRVFAPVPRRAIEAARATGVESRWTDPGHIVTSGAFMLREHRPADKTVLVRNPNYYESGLVALEEITFLSVVSGNTGANLYKTGNAHVGGALPPVLVKAVERKKDSCIAPNFFTNAIGMNANKRPFDNVLVRYALNMATDKEQIARFFGTGSTAARTYVPPVQGYNGPRNVMITMGARTYDVLAYDPAGARELLAQAGFPNGVDRCGRVLTLDYVFPQLPPSEPIAEIVQQQWRGNLNIAVRLVRQDFQAWIEKFETGDFGLIDFGAGGDYLDPNWFLELFTTNTPFKVGWGDPVYDAMLAEANGTADPALRMSRLAACEAHLLRAMPFVAVLFPVSAYLQKPYVRGLEASPLNMHPFKYTWIDTNWKPERS
jgi:ABC-type oligopeptide transport system substrate-binding subunit